MSDLLRKIKNKPFGSTKLASIIIIFGSFLTVVSYDILVPRLGPCDDWLISVLLSGELPNGGFCLFLNAVLAHLVYLANISIGMFNWFYIAEGISTALSASFILLIVSREKSFAVSLAIAGFLLIFVIPSCTYQSNFTVVASICSCAGIIGLASGVAKRHKAMTLFGAFFFTLGYMWRSSIGILAVPFLIIALASTSFIKNNKLTVSKREISLFAISFLLAIIPCLIAMGIHTVIWMDKPLNDWERINNAQSALNDYPPTEYSEIADQLKAIDVSENDYWLLTHRMFADPNIFTIDKIESVAKLQNHTATNIQVATKEYLHQMLANKRLLCALLAGLIFYIASTCGLRKLLPLATFLIALACCIYFTSTGRLPFRVEISVWLFWVAVCSSCYIVSKPSFDTSRIPITFTKHLTTLIGITSLTVVAIIFSHAIPNMHKANLSDYLHNQEENIPSMLIDESTGSDAVFVWDTSIFFVIPPEMDQRIVPNDKFFFNNCSLGGWQYGSPMTNARNEAYATDNLLHMLIEKENTYFVSTDEEKIDRVCVFLKEHYCKNNNVLYTQEEQVDTEYGLATIYSIYTK